MSSSGPSGPLVSTDIMNSRGITNILVVYYIKGFSLGSGSVVECLTRDRGAAGWSLTGGTALCP